jgi:hypothetical protein
VGEEEQRGPWRWRRVLELTDARFRGGGREVEEMPMGKPRSHMVIFKTNVAAWCISKYSLEKRVPKFEI